jgi:hypothetical protein
MKKDVKDLQITGKRYSSVDEKLKDMGISEKRRKNVQKLANSKVPPKLMQQINMRLRLKRPLTITRSFVLDPTWEPSSTTPIPPTISKTYKINSIQTVKGITWISCPGEQLMYDPKTDKFRDEESGLVLR